MKLHECAILVHKSVARNKLGRTTEANEAFAKAKELGYG